MPWFGVLYLSATDSLQQERNGMQAALVLPGSTGVTTLALLHIVLA